MIWLVSANLIWIMYKHFDIRFANAMDYHKICALFAALYL